MFIDFSFLKNFLRIFTFLFLWQCIKESNYLLFKRGLRLFKGLSLFFLPNVPGAMFIQGGTFILDSRVLCLKQSSLNTSVVTLKKVSTIIHPKNAQENSPKQWTKNDQENYPLKMSTRILHPAVKGAYLDTF